ncbi:MAG: helix-turn-helix domain-containing protein [Candidatus Dormibacteraceae bacterium]
MLIIDDDRPSDSPYVERVWRAHSEGGGSFVSIAESRWEMVVTRSQGIVTMTVRGPETRPTRMTYPADAEWLGIRFKPGTFMPSHPTRALVDGHITLPESATGRFWLNGSVWQVPDYENADTFVEWLRRDRQIVVDPAISAALRGESSAATQRTLQRRFVHVTGVTQGAARQIERARYATLILRRGASIAETTYEAGYFDQPHLTRSLKRLVGQTPAELRERQSAELSFLYKTRPHAKP